MNAMTADFDPRAAATAMRSAAAIFTNNGKAQPASVLLDIAAKIERFGSFASEKQRDYARNLVREARALAAPPAPVATDGAYYAAVGDKLVPANRRPAVGEFPKIAGLFGVNKAAHLHVGPVHVAANHDFDKLWVMYEELCVGFMEPATGNAHLSRKGRENPEQVAKLRAALILIEADPIRAMQEHGIATGRCSVCNRHLTNEDSIGLGIGPICRGKLGI